MPTTNGRQHIDADELASLLRGYAYTYTGLRRTDARTTTYNPKEHPWQTTD